MTASNYSVMQPFLPGAGKVYFTEHASPLVDVSNDLCRVAAFLQHRSPTSTVEFFHDWWEHDGLHFHKGETSFHDLFRIVGTTRALIESMTGEHRVFLAFSPADRAWYLRFFASWDDDNMTLNGEYSLALGDDLSGDFEANVQPRLKCGISTDIPRRYFQRIES